jgi:hypothetical protein
MRKFLLGIASVLGGMIMLTGAAGAANIYTSEAAFLAAAGGGLSFESFESPLSVTSTVVNFSGGSFGCSASGYCPGFFGVRTGFASDGVQTVYFATPSSATFTFNSPITAFGVDMIGPGTAGATDITINWVNGSSQIYTGITGSGYDVWFSGVIDSTPFISVTFSGTAADDGIDFDRLRFTGAVPEPETYAMLLAGLGLLGFIGRRRRQQAA